MTWKKAMAMVCALACLLGLSACTTLDTLEKENSPQQEQTEAASGEVREESTQQGDSVTDSEKKEFEERALYLYSEGVYPELWWAEGANASDLGTDLDQPLDLQIYETEYYHIDLFQSIEELKFATEQVVTKEYAEKYLYPWGEDRKMFTEYEEALYANAYWEGSFFFPPESVTFVRKDGDVIFLTAHFENLDGEPFTKETQFKLEDGIWKFQRTYLTEFFEEMLTAPERPNEDSES